MSQPTKGTSFRSVFGMFLTMALGTIVLMLAQTSTAKAQWGTSGTNIYNTNSGNVGVGTANPANGKLQVNKSIRIDDDSGNPTGSDAVGAAPNLYLGTTTGGGLFQFNGSGGIDLWQYNAGFGRTVSFSKTGNVGIGTTTPAARLDVQGTGYFSSVVSLGHATSFARLGQNLSVTNAANYGGMTLSTFSAVNADQAPVMDFNRSKSSTIGTYTAVANDDILGHIIFRGSTGAAFGDFARITGAVDGATIATGDTPGRLVFWTTPDGSGVMEERMRITNAGNVGIGTTTPTAKLHLISADDTVAPALSIRQDSNPLYGFDFALDTNVNGNLSVNRVNNGTSANVITLDRAGGTVGIGTSTPNSNYKLDINGNTNITGSFNASGTITGGTIVAKYQDVAEWVPASRALPAGTVVTLDPTKSNHVEASSQAYDTRVAGVVSEQPGITLGESGENKVLVATTGRVRVTVDASRAPIHIGDLLVTSDLPGVAMKSEPITIGGRQIHSPGTLIGKALEPLEKGSGKILVLLSLQ